MLVSNMNKRIEMKCSYIVVLILFVILILGIVLIFLLIDYSWNSMF